MGYLCPDVAIVAGEEIFYIEIFVKNKKKEKQVNLYRDNNLVCFEIDLSNVSETTTPNELTNLILCTAKFYFLHWNVKKELVKLEDTIPTFLPKETERKPFLFNISEKIRDFLEKI